MRQQSPSIKDANDLLRVWGDRGVAPETQVERIGELLDHAPTLLEEMAARAGRVQGDAKRDSALQEVFELAAALTQQEYALYRARLAKALALRVTELDQNVKVRRQTEKSKASLENATEVYGGVIKGWLLEYIYDPKEQQAMLAYRDPDGRCGTAESVVIEGQMYRAKLPYSFIMEGNILFPSELGRLRPEQEMAAIIAQFIRKLYLFDDVNMPWVIAFYVMLTWLYDSFAALPYLMATGDAGAGKSELMNRVGLICYRTISAAGANTAATFFRTTQMFKGTVRIDEADLEDGGDATNDIVKFLNLGAMKGNPISRLSEVINAKGDKEFLPEAYSTFCPKLIAMRRDFGDNAVGSRSLRLKLIAKEALELQQAGVPLHINDDHRAQAMLIRNDLLAWRLHRWQPEIALTDDLMDINLSARLNQVMMPLKALAKASGNEDFRRLIDRVLREHYAEEVLTRSMSVQARVVEAMWSIYTEPAKRKELLHQATDGQVYIFIGDVAKQANAIMDEMNAQGGGEDDSEMEGKRKKKKNELTPQGCGHIIREQLQLRVGTRTNKGFRVFWDQIKMMSMGKKYGVLPEDAAIAAVDGAAVVEDQPASSPGAGAGVNLLDQLPLV